MGATAATFSPDSSLPSSLGVDNTAGFLPTGAQAPNAVTIGTGATSAVDPTSSGSWIMPNAGAQAGGAGPTTSLGKFLANPSAGSGFDILAKNPGLALAGVGAGLTALKGTGSIPNIGALQAQASQLSAEGSQLTKSLLSGQLPAGAQASVDSLVQANQARVRQTFANMGLSGSTEEATALSQAAEQGKAMAFQIAQQMATQGLGETQTGAQLLSQISQMQLASDQELQNAIVAFAQMAAGGGGIQLKLA